jgi:uncharacterized protein YkwD
MMIAFCRTLLVASLAIGSLFPWTSALGQSKAGQSKAGTAEQQLFQAINRERAAHRLPPLKWNDALASAAREHAQVMAARKAIAHGFPGEPSLPSRVKQAGVHFSWLSENIAVGPTAANISEQWMQSPNHRANLLDADMDTVGAGTVQRNGVMFAVADFSKAKN